MVKVGIIGFGVMGKNHFRAVSALEGVEVDWVYDPYQNAQVLEGTDLLEDLSRANFLEIDYVIVASPPGSHLSNVRKVVNLSRKGEFPKLLIEKPLVSSREDAAALKELLGDVVGCHTGFVERFNPVFRKLREMVLAEDFGKILSIRTVRHSTHPGRSTGVGVGQDLGSHDIDLVRFISGQEYESLQISSIASSGELDSTHVSVGFLSGGALVSHSASWDYKSKTREVEINFTKAVVTAHSLTQEISVCETTSGTPLWEGPAQLLGTSLHQSKKISLTGPEPLVAQHSAILGMKLDPDVLASPPASIADGLAVADLLLTNVEVNS